MNKERSTAFFDAVLAIIMTILVLELDRPSELTWAAIWALKRNYFAYALSFFWLGTMWINIHNMWDSAKKVSIRTIWTELILLFFSSFFPYTTALVSRNFNNSVAQVLYGLDVLAVSLAFMMMAASTVKDNMDDDEFRRRAELFGYGKWSGWILYDIGLKVIGVILSATVFPPATLLFLLATVLFLVLPNQLRSKE